MTEDKKNNYSGVWGNRVGFGERPALIVIDFMKLIPQKVHRFSPQVLSGQYRKAQRF